MFFLFSRHFHWRPLYLYLETDPEICPNFAPEHSRYTRLHDQLWKKLLKKYSFTNLLFGNNLLVKSYIKIIAREESYKLEGWILSVSRVSFPIFNNVDPDPYAEYGSVWSFLLIFSNHNKPAWQKWMTEVWKSVVLCDEFV